MGFQAFKELWKRKDNIHIKLLLLNNPLERKMFAPYLKIDKKKRLTIIWGDAVNFIDVKKSISGTDFVLDAMAFISPQADYQRDKAKAVNITGIENIVRAISEEPDGNERIPLVYTGTVAETGDRLNELRLGRTGDPLKPSIYDTYAVTKIAGERIVLESSIKRWVSLRMTFIMPMTWKKIANLMDPIFFHQPLTTHMENVTSRDAGFGMVNCLDIKKDSDFWCRIYNMGGGPKMRCTTWQFLKLTLGFSGLDNPEKVYERKWFALKNFHMHYYMDSYILNSYLHYWRDSLENWKEAVYKNQNILMKTLRFLCKNLRLFRKIVESETKKRMRKMAVEHRNGTAYWYKHNKEKRLLAFFGGREKYESIPDWDHNRDFEGPFPEPVKLDHGYDESKSILNVEDLRKAATFRGGQFCGSQWNGDLMESLSWSCSKGHQFNARVNTILKGGHWCPNCSPPEWDFDGDALGNPFFRQVWENTEKQKIYTEQDCDDISMK